MGKRCQFGSSFNISSLRNKKLSNINKIKIISLLAFTSLFLVGSFSVAKAASDIPQSLNIPELVRVLNQERINNDLHPLRRNQLLDAAATLKAAHMVNEKYFAHTSPTGTTPWHWFNVTGYTYEYAGENLALGFNDPEKVIEAWMQSPKHKENILNSKYSDVGYGISYGEFEYVNDRPRKKKGIIIVQLFGSGLVAQNNQSDPLTNLIALGSQDSKSLTNVDDLNNIITELQENILPKDLEKEKPIVVQNSSLKIKPANSPTVPPISLPVVSIGIAMLMLSAGIHTKMV